MRVVITGAAGGIGTAAVAELRAAGRLGRRASTSRGADVVCDVRDQASVDAAVASAIAVLGGLDVLINNAGLGTPQSAAAAPDADALEVLDVNLVGPWRVTAAALPALRESRGRVINVASGLAHVTVPFATAYTMSKRGVVAYSDALRLEEGDRITVTTVYPGYIRTPHPRTLDGGGRAARGRGAGRAASRMPRGCWLAPRSGRRRAISRHPQRHDRLRAGATAPAAAARPGDARADAAAGAAGPLRPRGARRRVRAAARASESAWT